MSNTLLLHIGTPKTGTSSLQHCLYHNRNQLLQAGWDYPNLKLKLSYLCDYGHNPAKNGNVFYGGIKLYPEGSEESDSILRILEDSVRDNNVLLSAEEFYEYDTEELLGRIKERISNVKVIVYFRRQDLYVESRWNQIVKDDRCYKGTFSQYVKESEKWGEGHYLQKLDNISKIVGKEHITVGVFEREQLLKGNVIDDFLNLIGINGVKITDGYDHNDALEGKLVEVKRALNQIYDVQRYGSARLWSDALKRAYEIIPKAFMNGKSYFSPAERSEYLSGFEAENREIAQRFLGRTDGELFKDTNIDIPKTDYEIDEVVQAAIQALMKEALERIIIESEKGGAS